MTIIILLVYNWCVHFFWSSQLVINFGEELKYRIHKQNHPETHSQRKRILP